ncbi:hypothetical protein H0O00_05250 [Candidatus Micrarchaeota archaeon]|nr:hypothetical protein [Candidatus Micrarchaeota archaeon]
MRNLKAATEAVPKHSRIKIPKGYEARKRLVELYFELKRRKPDSEAHADSRPFILSKRSNARAEREIAKLVGTNVSIVRSHELDAMLGQDAIDRLISEARKKR